MDDLAIQRICNLKLRVLAGEVTDWPGDHHLRHITHMTCHRFFLLAVPIPDCRWQWQLAQICHHFRIAPEGRQEP
jgi:hypothetical protein